MIFSHLYRRAKALEAGAGPHHNDRRLLGAQAKRLLDDPVLTLAFERVRSDIEDQWRSSAVNEREKREEAYRLLWALENVRTKLRAMLGNARILEEEDKRKQREAEREARLKGEA